jgi:hypothetical protein
VELRLQVTEAVQLKQEGTKYLAELASLEQEGVINE